MQLGRVGGFGGYAEKDGDGLKANPTGKRNKEDTKVGYGGQRENRTKARDGSARGRAAPQEIGGDAEQQQDHGDFEVEELAGIAKGEQDRISDDRSGGQNEEKWRDRITWHAIRKRDAQPLLRAAKGKNRGFTKQSMVAKPGNCNTQTNARNSFWTPSPALRKRSALLSAIRWRANLCY